MMGDGGVNGEVATEYSRFYVVRYLYLPYLGPFSGIACILLYAGCLHMQNKIKINRLLLL